MGAHALTWPKVLELGKKKKGAVCEVLVKQ